MSPVDLAAAVDRSRSYISGIENGSDRPGRDTLATLAKELGTTVDYLLHGREVPVPQSAQLVDDPDKLALLRFWDGLEDDQRTAVLSMLLAMRRAA